MTVGERAGFDVDDAAVYDSTDGNIFSTDDVFEFDDAATTPEEPDDGYIEPDDVGEGPSGDAPIQYDGGDVIKGLPTREDLVHNSCPELRDKIGAHIKNRKGIFFMPNAVEESNDYIRGCPTYRLHLFGPLMDGSKAHVVLEDIDVTFGVRVPERPPTVAKLSKAGRARLEVLNPEAQRKQAFEDHLRQVFAENNVQIRDAENFSAFPSFGYHIDQCSYKKITTADTKQRKSAIAAVRSYGYDTVMDDRSAYYRKVSREYGLPLTEWMTLSNYRYEQGRSKFDPLSSHVFRVSVRDVKPLIDPMADKEDREKRSKIKQSNPHLLKDRTLVMGWDIETHSSRKTGDLPKACNPEDKTFCLACTFHWKDSPDVLLRVCMVDKPTHPDSRWTTIVCGSEQNIFRAWSLVWRAMAPDVSIGFNDSDYDYPFVVERAHQYEDLAWMMERMSAMPRAKQTSESVYKWNFRRDVKIKITPEETFYSSFLQVPGCVPMDIRVCFKKLYPKSEVAKGSSLNFYLKACKLPGKADMPVVRMWRGYESGDLEMMRKIIHYCIVDCWRCQQLQVKRNVVNDGREVALLSYCSLFDAHYYAGGMKVCNMLNAYAGKRNIACSSIAQEKAEKGKYPGAFVFPPDKGLENKRPVTGVDAASLYPSIIMAFNLSPETIIIEPQEAEKLAKEGKVLHPISFMFNGRPVKGWSVRHRDKQENIGLYPSILIDLFAKRKEMKKKLEPLQKLKELLESIMGTAGKEKISLDQAVDRVVEIAHGKIEQTEKTLAVLTVAANPDKRAIKVCEHKISDSRAEIAAIESLRKSAEDSGAAIADMIQSEYGRVSFEYEAANSKQKALKVFMNTFYGEAGNSRSPWFLLQLAGGVTSAGQNVIKSAWAFAKKKGFKLKYGDTDSLYLVAGDEEYADCDAAYAAGTLTKEEYWAEMVKITMNVIEEFLVELNSYLAELFETKYLTFAYEDVLFPCVFTGKKKYFAIAHVNMPNFRPKELFIRGIDVVKQGQTGLSKDIGYRIMWEAMSITNTRTMEGITEATLVDAVKNGTQWKFEHFVQTDAYKPDKDNKPVQKFIARMRIKHAAEVEENKKLAAAGTPTKPYLYEIPEAGERFRYVIPKRGADFDMRGYRASAKKGDVMEFAHVAQALNLPIDVAFYMKSYVTGLCARFINGADKFQPPPESRMDEKAADKYSQNKAKKHLEGIILGATNADKKTTTARGYAYKRAYKFAAEMVQEPLIDKIGAGADVLHGDYLSYDLFLDDEDDGTEEPEEGNPAGAVSKCMDRLVTAAQSLADAAGGNSTKTCETIATKLGIAPDGTDVDATTTKNLYSAISITEPPPPRARRRRLTYRDLFHSALVRQETAARHAIAAALPRVTEAAIKFQVDLDTLVQRFRQEEHVKNPALNGSAANLSGQMPPAADIPDGFALNLDESDRMALQSLRRAWYSLVGVFMARRQENQVLQHLVRLRGKRIGLVRRPADVGGRQFITMPPGKPHGK